METRKVKHSGKRKDSHFERDLLRGRLTEMLRDSLKGWHFVMDWHWGFLKGRH